MHFHVVTALAFAGSVLSALLPFERDNTTGYGTLTTESMLNGSVMRVAINNPPLNLYDYKLNTDMLDFLSSLGAAGIANGTSPSSPPKVVIFHSVVPDFFMWWIDVNYFVPGDSPFNQTYLNALFDATGTTVELLRSLPTIFIAEVDGRASGSGDEFLLQCDMSFVGPNAVLSNPEAALGGMAGNGGTEYLVRALGIQRASEYLLAALPVQGAEAAALGWVNKAFPSSDSLTSYVDGLAERIAHIDAAALNITKGSLRNFGPTAAQSAADLSNLLRVANTNVATFKREIALAGNFTAPTQWLLDMFSSLESLQALLPNV